MRKVFAFRHINVPRIVGMGKAAEMRFIEMEDKPKD